MKQPDHIFDSKDLSSISPLFAAKWCKMRSLVDLQSRWSFPWPQTWLYKFETIIGERLVDSVLLAIFGLNSECVNPFLSVVHFERPLPRTERCASWSSTQKLDRHKQRKSKSQKLATNLENPGTSRKAVKNLWDAKHLTLNRRSVSHSRSAQTRPDWTGSNVDEDVCGKARAHPSERPIQPRH